MSRGLDLGRRAWMASMSPAAARVASDVAVGLEAGPEVAVSGRVAAWGGAAEAGEVLSAVGAAVDTDSAAACGAGGGFLLLGVAAAERVSLVAGAAAESDAFLLPAVGASGDEVFPAGAEVNEGFPAAGEVDGVFAAAAEADGGFPEAAEADGGFPAGVAAADGFWVR